MSPGYDIDRLPSRSGDVPAGVNDLPAGGNDVLVGRNAVLEALKSERPLNKVFIQKSLSEGSIRKIEAVARSAGIPVLIVEKAWLDRLTKSVHQGVAAYASAKEYCDVRDVLEYAAQRSEKPLIVVAGEIVDPNNLGAIIRSAEAAGAHGVIIPKRNAAGLTAAVSKSSAGAIEYMRIARTSNITAALRLLKENGVWIVGADASGGKCYTDCDFTVSVALVIGGEGGGLSRLVRENCDYIVSIPMLGKISSLNASAAASVLLYEALRQRGAR